MVRLTRVKYILYTSGFNKIVVNYLRNTAHCLPHAHTQASHTLTHARHSLRNCRPPVATTHHPSHHATRKNISYSISRPTGAFATKTHFIDSVASFSFTSLPPPPVAMFAKWFILLWTPALWPFSRAVLLLSHLLAKSSDVIINSGICGPTVVSCRMALRCIASYRIAACDTRHRDDCQSVAARGRESEKYYNRTKLHTAIWSMYFLCVPFEVRNGRRRRRRHRPTRSVLFIWSIVCISVFHRTPERQY